MPMSLRCFLGMHTTKHPFIKWNPERLECRRCGKTLAYGRDYHPHRYDEDRNKKRSLHGVRAND
jgi:hypothetical protein